MSLPVRLALLTAVMALVLVLFAWPSARLEPRAVPVGVVGPAPAALADPAAYDLRRYASEAQARAAVMEREIYAAVAGRTVFVATGASPAVAAAIRQAAPQARVVDLAPGTRADPRVATLVALTLPLTLLGIVTALLATFTARGHRERAGLVLGGAVAAGALAALVAQTWLGALPGPWLGVAGVAALGVLAVAAFVAGLAAHLGRPGIGIGAVLMMLVANPWSGVAAAPELLPAPAGAIGQLLPAGAAGDLLRSVAFFECAGGGAALAVLTVWAVAGLTLLATASVRERRRGRAAAPAPVTA